MTDKAKKLANATGEAQRPRDWDPEAALSRIAGGDVASFTAQLHSAAEQYPRSKEHLSFEELQSLARRDGPVAPEHEAHLSVCEFCTGLRETLSPTAAEVQAFVELAKTY